MQKLKKRKSFSLLQETDTLHSERERESEMCGYERRVARKKKCGKGLREGEGFWFPISSRVYRYRKMTLQQSSLSLTLYLCTEADQLSFSP